MQAVLISIQPYWVFLIIAKAMGWNIDKEKMTEIRKNFPKASDWNKTVKIYCSKDKKSFAKIPKEYQPLMQQFLGKVIGEFVCDKIDYWQYSWMPDVMHIEDMSRLSCVPTMELINYLGRYVDKKGYNKRLYAWHISDLVIYDKPKELSEFRKTCVNELYCESCAMYSNFYDSCGNVALRLKRPPQSWCYVEEI